MSVHCLLKEYMNQGIQSTLIDYLLSATSSVRQWEVERNKSPYLSSRRGIDYANELTEVYSLSLDSMTQYKIATHPVGLLNHKAGFSS